MNRSEHERKALSPASEVETMPGVKFDSRKSSAAGALPMNIAAMNAAKMQSGVTLPGIATGKAKRNYDAMKLIGIEAPEPWRPGQPMNMTSKGSEHTELASPNAFSGWQSPADLRKAFAELPEEAHDLVEDSMATRLVKISKASEGVDDGSLA